MDNAFEEVIRLGGLETEIDYPYDGKGEAVNRQKLPKPNFKPKIRLTAFFHYTKWVGFNRKKINPFLCNDGLPNYIKLSYKLMHWPCAFYSETIFRSYDNLVKVIASFI